MRSVSDGLKAKLKGFLRQVIEHMDEIGREVTQYRVRFVLFRDFACCQKAIEETDFYNIPLENGYSEVDEYIDGIQFEGDCEYCNALEAIALALKSDWSAGGSNRRHAILVISNTPVSPLGARKDCPDYPEGMPSDLTQLSMWWEGLEQPGGTYQYKKGRLVAFVPPVESWFIMKTWNRYWPAYCNSLEDLTDYDYESALEIITFYD